MSTMREILFRAKTYGSGEWVYGYLTRRPQPGEWGEKHGPWYIDVPPAGPDDSYKTYYVDPYTIGQYTGLQGEDGKRIFEGDIAEVHYFYEGFDAGTLGVYEAEETCIAKIGINNYGVYFEAKDECDLISNRIQEPSEEIKVIGNVYDNPELLQDDKEWRM